MRLLMVLAIFFVAQSGQALSLKEKKIVKGWTEELAGNLEAVKKNCGKAIPAVMDDAWIKEIPDYLGHSMTQACEEALGYISEMCKDADAKEAIVKKISSLRCYPIKAGEPKFELSAGVFKIYAGKEAYPQDKTKKFLENNL